MYGVNRSVRMELMTVSVVLMLGLYLSGVSGVTVPAVITDPPQNMTAPVGANRTFSCRGNGMIVWVLGGVQVRSSMRLIQLANEGIYTNYEQQNFSQVVMTASVSLNMSMLRALRCRMETGDIITGFSTVESDQVSLLVYGKPSPPFSFTAVTQQNGILLTWDQFTHEEETVNFIINATKDGSPDTLTLTVSASPYLFNQSIGERDCSLYQFVVQSQNVVGVSAGSEIGSGNIPTAPRQLQNTDVTITVSLASNVVTATIQFEIPSPCSTFPVSSYKIRYSAFVNVSDTIPSEQRRDILFGSLNRTNEAITLGSAHGLLKDRMFVMNIVAINNIGETASSDIIFYSTSVQSAIVKLAENKLATVNCVFAAGATADTCMIIFNLVTADNNRTFLFTQSLTREPNSLSAVGSVRLDIPEDATVEALVFDVSPGGSVGGLYQYAMISGPADLTTPSPTDTQTTPITGSVMPTTSPSVPQGTIVPLGETLYIIIGAGGGGILLLLILIVFMVCCVCLISRRKKKPHTVSTKDSDGLNDNQAYGGIQLTGASAIPNGNNDYNSGRKRNNTYITSEHDPNDFTVSGVGPAYETIEDAKKAAKAAGSTAPNPIYASATTGSQSHLVDNPVYSETVKPPLSGTEGRKCYTDVSALNPVYSGLGLPPQGTGSAGRLPHSHSNFPYQSMSPVPTLSPVSSPQNGTTFVYSDIPPSAPSAELLPQKGGMLNRSQSTENQSEQPLMDPVYEEIVQKSNVRVRTAVSVSSDHGSPGFPLGKNESYGRLTRESTSPINNSPTVPLIPPTSSPTIPIAPPTGDGPLPTSPPPSSTSRTSSENATLV